MSQQELLRQLDAIMQRIRRACARCGRDPREVRLLLATKTVPAERILFALQAGQTLIGENKVQEIRDNGPIELTRAGIGDIDRIFAV